MKEKGTIQIKSQEEKNKENVLRKKTLQRFQ